MPLPVVLEFSGGAELLVGGVRRHEATLPDKETPWTLRDLLMWIKDNLLKERPELFVFEGSVRPGILVLVNDNDWELLDGLDYVLEPKDVVVFISTLHGG